MTTASVKQQVHEMAEQLPEDATWDDVVYRMVVRREIEEGIADSKAGRVTPVEDVMKEFGVSE